MRLIFLKNKEIFDNVAVPTMEKISVVIRQNQPWPFGLRQKSSPTTSLRLSIVPLCTARNSLWSNDFCQQQNTLYLVNNAWERKVVT